MTFNDLIKQNGIEEKEVMVLRHRPRESQLRKVLPWLAAEKPSVFNAYQQGQGVKVEKAMQRAKYVAACIGMGAGKATFVGFYRKLTWKTVTTDEMELIPEMIELFSYGMARCVDDKKRAAALWFDLQVTDILALWKGKLIIEWPGLERSWMRWAERNTFNIHAIRETSAFDAQIPEWDELTLKQTELQAIPSRLKNRLREWRGIYFIYDSSTGKGYVGSAYGSDNILGRCENYAKSGHGGNQLLKKCDPKNFVFSILQRVSPDSLPDEVIRIENSWKERLHTRAPSGLNDN